MPSITLYTRPGCQPCLATERKFKRHGLSYSTVDTSTDEAAAERLRQRGYRETPVVEVYRDHDLGPDAQPETWTGFRPDLIDALAGVKR